MTCLRIIVVLPDLDGKLLYLLCIWHRCIKPIGMYKSEREIRWCNFFSHLKDSMESSGILLPTTLHKIEALGHVIIFRYTKTMYVLMWIPRRKTLLLGCVFRNECRMGDTLQAVGTGKAHLFVAIHKDDIGYCKIQTPSLTTPYIGHICFLYVSNPLILCCFCDPTVLTSIDTSQRCPFAALVTWNTSRWSCTTIGSRNTDHTPTYYPTRATGVIGCLALCTHIRSLYGTYLAPSVSYMA